MIWCCTDYLQSMIFKLIFHRKIILLISSVIVSVNNIARVHIKSMGKEVMDDGGRNRSVFDWGEKQMSKPQAFEVTSSLAMNTSNHSSFSKLGKRKRINGCTNSTCSLLKNYSNFMRSCPPKRILFHKNGEWNDFPQGLVDLVREDFLMKKAVIKVQFNDITVMLDMLYMVQVDLKTGSPQPIAWIDEAGCCFFPEISSWKAQKRQLCESPLDTETVSCGSHFNGAHELKLHIEIDLNGLNSSSLDECVEESNVGTKRLNIEQVSDQDVDKGNGIRKADGNPQNGFWEDKHSQLEPAHQFLDTDVIRNLFHMAMKPFSNVNILEIVKCSSSLLQMRLELFEKQVEITKKCRGNSNVKYAWFPCSKDVSSIICYGLWHGGSEQRIKYGNGVHLNAVNNAHASASTSDGDENGVRKMVFCRVILGNMEVLHPGSKQFHPSNENFDSGVDNLKDPSCYIVWNTNASTHIFPEYVVSFKMPSAAEGSMGGEENNVDISGVTSQERQGQMQISCSALDKGRSHPYQISHKEAPNAVASCSKGPKSPAMRFTSLFEAMADKISAKDMREVYVHYELFMRKKISRDQFIFKLRQTVGDQLLKSTLTAVRDANQ